MVLYFQLFPPFQNTISAQFPQISPSFCTYFESSFSSRPALAPVPPSTPVSSDSNAPPRRASPSPRRPAPPLQPPSRSAALPLSDLSPPTLPTAPTTHGEYFQPPPTRPPLPLCTSTILLQSTTHNSTVSSCCRPVPSTASLIFSLFFWFFGHF
jgi:hypothetical protein